MPSDCGGLVEILIPGGCASGGVSGDVITSTTITETTVIADGGTPFQVFVSNPTAPSMLIFPTPGVANADRMYIVKHMKAAVLMTLVGTFDTVANFPMDQRYQTVWIFNDGSALYVVQNLVP